MKRLYSFVILLGVVIYSYASVPECRLFQFERSKNRNYICYDVNQKQELLNMDNPVDVYWIRVEEGGGRKELSFFQRKMAFGYKVIHKGSNEVSIHLTAYDKLPIRICRKLGKWIAMCTIHGKDMQITKMFAQLRSPNSLHVEYVDIYGVNTVTGLTIRERINNN